MIVKKAFEKYIEEIKYISKETTIATYHNRYYKHLDDFFGTRETNSIDNVIVNKFIEIKLNAGLSKSYINTILTLLYSVISNTTEKRLKTKLKNTNKRIEVFAEKEQIKIEKYALNNLNTVTVAILMSLYTGIRIGELCALKINDICINNNILRIDETMQRIKNIHGKKKTKIVVDTPKSESSIRSIPLPKFICKIIKNIIIGVDKNAYFLTLKTNKFIEPRLLEYKYEQFMNECKVEYKNFHVLRHTFATNCIIRSLIDIKSLSEILGHSNVEITLQKYIHSNMEVKKTQMESVNLIFLARHNLTCQ